MVVAIDPETGKLGMPSPEQLRELNAPDQRALDRARESIPEIHLPDGTVGLDLQGRLQDHAVVRIGRDGKPIFRCFDDAAGARRAVSDSLPPALEEE